jgi:hypothetical protein
VTFTLRHAAGSEEEAAFFAAAAELGEIPGVERFEMLRQVGAKNEFRYGFSMEFAGPEAYASYDAHPVHRRFVEERWVHEVADFLELDYTAR